MARRPNRRSTIRSLPIASVCRELERRHGSPRHGNKSNPLDELIYIILSTRTRDQSFRETYRLVRRRYPSWRLLGSGQRQELTRLLAPGGLGRLKADQIIAILGALSRKFGYPTLAPLKYLSDDEAQAVLTSLPGVGPKIAKCVLMYSLGREVLPVDVHVHRVASRLGLRTKRRPDTSQELVEGAIPKRLRYGFHVNAIAHGRSICLPRYPRCAECCLQRYCLTYRKAIG